MAGLAGAEVRRAERTSAPTAANVTPRGDVRRPRCGRRQMAQAHPDSAPSGTPKGSHYRPRARPTSALPTSREPRTAAPKPTLQPSALPTFPDTRSSALPTFPDSRRAKVPTPGLASAKEPRAEARTAAVGSAQVRSPELDRSAQLRTPLVGTPVPRHSRGLLSPAGECAGPWSWVPSHCGRLARHPNVS